MRIHGWGELGFDTNSQNLFNQIHRDYWSGLILRLDQPIRIDPEATQLAIQSNIPLPERAEVNLDHGCICRSIRADIIPNEFIGFFLGKEYFPFVALYLDNIDRRVRNIEMPDGGADLGIDLYTWDPIHNSDRFLQSFARKLNKWLAKINGKKNN